MLAVLAELSLGRGASARWTRGTPASRRVMFVGEWFWWRGLRPFG